MISAIHFENLLFLLFIFVAFLFQMLTRAATKTGKGPGEAQRRPPTRTPPVPRGQPETDEEQIRKFLEALGRAPGSAPPVPVKPRPTYQKPVVLRHVGPGPSPLPPLTTRPPPLPHELRPAAQSTTVRERKIYQPKVAESLTFEVHHAPPSVEVIPIPKVPEQASPIQIATPAIRAETNFAELLKSPSGLRDAIILREIFGPPRAFSD